MSSLGSFGSVLFAVSSEKVLTWLSLQRGQAGRFARHEVLEGKPLLEFLGPSLDSFDLSIRLDANLGVDPEQVMEELRGYATSGEEQALILGGRHVGRYCLLEVREQWTRHDGQGAPSTIFADLRLEEYVD